jgi:hypothetical protein
LPVEADDIVTLRVVRVLDGTVRSLTQMAVALPDAVAAAPPVAAGGQADAGVAANTGAAGAEGSAGGSGGIELAPGEVLPPLPELTLRLPVPLAGPRSTREPRRRPCRRRPFPNAAHPSQAWGRALRHLP